MTFLADRAADPAGREPRHPQRRRRRRWDSEAEEPPRRPGAAPRARACGEAADARLTRSGARAPGVMPSWRPISRSGVGLRRRCRSASRRPALAVGQLPERARSISSESEMARGPRARGPSRQQVAERGVVALPRGVSDVTVRAASRSARSPRRHLGLGRDLGSVGGGRAWPRAGSRSARLALVAHQVDRQLDRARLGIHPALGGLADHHVAYVEKR